MKVGGGGGSTCGRCSFRNGFYKIRKSSPPEEEFPWEDTSG